MTILAREQIEKWIDDGFTLEELELIFRSHEALRKENIDLKRQLEDFERLKDRLAKGKVDEPI